MKKTKNKTCIDCLHCKVSAKSTVNNRMCYCSMSQNREQHKELYWSERKVCGEFSNMGKRITLRVPRAPLLKGADFLGGLSRRS
jgi:hypothetical protein